MLPIGLIAAKQKESSSSKLESPAAFVSRRRQVGHSLSGSCDLCRNSSPWLQCIIFISSWCSAPPWHLSITIVHVGAPNLLTSLLFLFFCLLKGFLYVTSVPFIIVLRPFIVSAVIYRRFFLLWAAWVHHRGRNDTETFCLWMQMASGGGGGGHKESGPCPNGCGLESSPVGIPGASGRRPHRAPLARTHYRVTFRTAAAPPLPMPSQPSGLRQIM